MENILTVGYHKGEMDFGVNCSIDNLTYEQMKEFRNMVCVAIGQAEKMWAKGRPQPTTSTVKELTTPPKSPNSPLPQ